jgi:hypothetical protein
MRRIWVVASVLGLAACGCALDPIDERSAEAGAAGEAATTAGTAGSAGLAMAGAPTAGRGGSGGAPSAPPANEGGAAGSDEPPSELPNEGEAGAPGAAGEAAGGRGTKPITKGGSGGGSSGSSAAGGAAAETGCEWFGVLTLADGATVRDGEFLTAAGQVFEFDCSLSPPCPADVPVSEGARWIGFYGGWPAETLAEAIATTLDAYGIPSTHVDGVVRIAGGGVAMSAPTPQIIATNVCE